MSRTHEIFISAETTSENVLRRAVDEENNDGRRRDVRYRPFRKGSRPGWLLDSSFKISEDWVEQLQRATLIEERTQRLNPPQNYGLDSHDQDIRAYQQDARLMSDPRMQVPRTVQDPRFHESRYQDPRDIHVTSSRHQAYSSADQDPSIPGYTLSPSAQPVGSDYTMAQPRDYSNETPPPTTRGSQSMYVQPGRYLAASQGPQIMVDPRTGRQLLVPVPAGTQSRSGPESQPSHPPMRSDSRDASNSTQRRDSKYSRHTTDPNGGSITVTSGRSGTLPTSLREDFHPASAQDPVESRRIPRSTSLQQENFPPRSSSLKRHAGQGSDPSQRQQEEAYQARLSRLALLFAEIGVADFMDCYQFIKARPEILDSDSNDFLREALYALRIGKDVYARQCIARAVMLEACKSMSKKATSDYFFVLSNRKGGVFRAFQSESKRILVKLEEKMGQVAGPKPAPEVSSALSSMRRLSIAPTSQVTQARTDASLDRHGLPLNKPAKSKPPKPKPKPDDDDDDDDSTMGHKIAWRHADRGPDDDDDDDDDETFGHKIDIRSRAVKHDDNEADYSDEPELDFYGRHVDRGKRSNVDIATRDARKRSDQGGRERVPPGASTRPKGDDDDDDDDDDGTFGHKEISRPTPQRDERKRSDREAAHEFRPTITSKDSGRRSDRNATRDSRQKEMILIDPGPKRSPQSTARTISPNSKRTMVPSSNAESRHRAV